MNKILNNKWWVVAILAPFSIFAIIFGVLAINQNALQIMKNLNGSHVLIDAMHAAPILNDGLSSLKITLAFGILGIILGLGCLGYGVINLFIPKKNIFFEGKSDLLNRHIWNVVKIALFAISLIATIFVIVSFVFGVNDSIVVTKRFIVIKTQIEDVIYNNYSISNLNSELVKSLEEIKSQFGVSIHNEFKAAVAIKIATEKASILEDLINAKITANLTSAINFFNTNPTSTTFPNINLEINNLKSLITSLESSSLYNNKLNSNIVFDAVPRMIPYDKDSFLGFFRQLIANIGAY